jgi:hypothetical protein
MVEWHSRCYETRSDLGLVHSRTSHRNPFAWLWSNGMASTCPCGCGRQPGSEDAPAVASASTYLAGLPVAWRTAKLLESIDSNDFAFAYYFLTGGLLRFDQFVETIHARVDRRTEAFAADEAPMATAAEVDSWAARSQHQTRLLSALDPNWRAWWADCGMPVADLGGRPGLRDRSRRGGEEFWWRPIWNGQLQATSSTAPALPTPVEIVEHVSEFFAELVGVEPNSEAGKPGYSDEVLGEEVEVVARCVDLGSGLPPERSINSGFQGFILVGVTYFGVVDPRRSITRCCGGARYADISAVAFRREEDETGNGTWLFEFVVNFPRGEEEDFISHHAVRLPAPTASGDPDVTDVVMMRIRQQSRFDLSESFGSEETVPGMLLLPISDRLEASFWPPK